MHVIPLQQERNHFGGLNSYIYMYRLPYPCMYSYMNYSCVGLHECIHEYTDTYMRRCIICISDRFFLQILIPK